MGGGGGFGGGDETLQGTLASHNQACLISAGVLGRVSPQSGVTQRDLNVKEAWAQGFTGRGIVVSILDDGIEKNHPDLAGNYVSRSGGGQRSPVSMSGGGPVPPGLLGCS